MNCDRFADQLADFLERTVSEQTRASIEAHALACDDCGPLLADLRKLRVDAANLPEMAPSRDLWSGINARIETPVVELGNGIGYGRSSIASPSRRQPNRALWLGLAAAGLVAVTATVTHEITKRSIAPTPTVASTKLTVPVASPTVATPTIVASTSASDSTALTARAVPTSKTPIAVAPTSRLASAKSAKPSADQTYDSEIAKLRAVLNYRRHDLDSSTVSVVDKNLRIIDDAIAQCRFALKKDPASRFLMESLNEALDSKVQLLRTAATLPSRT